MTSPTRVPAAPGPAASAPAPERAARAAVRAFEDAGAVSPATARPLAEVALGGDLEAVVALAACGAVREATPGRYYLHAGTAHARRRALVAGLAVLAAVALLPVFLVQLTR